MPYQKLILAIYLAVLYSILGSCEKDEARAASDPSPVSQAVNSSDKLNILVIIADDMGIDTLSFYGKSDDVARTPHLEALARQGLVFENAWATPAC